MRFWRSVTTNMMNKLLGKYARVRGNQGLHSYHVKCASSFPIFSVSSLKMKSLNLKRNHKLQLGIRVSRIHQHTFIIHHQAVRFSLSTHLPSIMPHGRLSNVKWSIWNRRYTLTTKWSSSHECLQIIHWEPIMANETTKFQGESRSFIFT